MKDSRLEQLAKNLLDYSINLQKGENILIEINTDSGMPFAKELVKYTYVKGGVPFLTIGNQQLLRELLIGCNKEQIELMAEAELVKMNNMQAYIAIRSADNISELSDVESEKMDLYFKYYMEPVHIERRVKHTKWCLLRYPNASMAQLAGMSTEQFEDFYFSVCNLDYDKMSKAMNPLIELINRTDKVRIVSNDTNLTFSIKGIGSKKCDGHRNIPDGEVFTAPVRDSVNGIITYNTPTIYKGHSFSNICFEFKDGKIIKATSNDTENLNKILNIDEGARYIGEFALGFNPYIETPMKDTLFDEKIKGSFHFTPGGCLPETDNGNVSANHWDLVQIQTLEYGGGEIWFDDALIRKDGIFVLDKLKCLNPENLK